MTDRQDANDRRPEVHPRLLLARCGFLAFAFVVLTGIRGCDDMRPPTITCEDVDLQIEPGTCVSFANPCNESGRWARPPAYDGFQLEPDEELEETFGANMPFSVHTTRSRDETTRSICVRADSPLFVVRMGYRYGLGPDYGDASIFLRVASPLTVDVAASPTHLALGERAQLVAIVRGGIPPYFYGWVPTSGLDDSDIAAPIASPIATTEYRVRVTDSGGQEVVRGVTVTVGTDLMVTAHPPEISFGDAAILLAIVYGGTPPYTFSWTPADSLDDPFLQNPIAAPIRTTTYQVVARDSAGATLAGSATVTVRLEVAATAQPQDVVAGETTALLATVRGGRPPYTFAWTPADTLDDPERQGPVASPTTATTYQVIARDSAGAEAAGVVTVQVTGSDPPPTASFVFAVDCCPRLELDASASTGRIVAYAWDLGWTSANPDRITSSPTTSFTIQEFNRGTITLTVTGADGRTATAMRNF